MKLTSVWVNPSELADIVAAVRKQQTRDRLESESNMTIVDVPTTKSIYERINDLALAYGLPPLPNAEYYGMTTEGEFVAP